MKYGIVALLFCVGCSCQAHIVSRPSDSSDEFEATADSMARMENVTRKAVATKTVFIADENYHNDKGELVVNPMQHLYLVSTDRKYCRVDTNTYPSVMIGDTISCQWAQKAE